MGKRRSMSAQELMQQLEADPGWVAMRDARDARRAKRLQAHRKYIPDDLETTEMSASIAPSDVESLMQQMNQSAFEVASSFDINLDYTDSSVRRVEAILAEIHREYAKHKDDSGLGGIALFFAAYLGEVIRRKGLGGNWTRNHPDIGDDTFPFYWNGRVLFLYGWCRKRILDGQQDDVWLKYEQCVLQKIKTA